MIINTYETTYGRVLNISKLITSLQEYLIKTNLKNLNYEYPINEDVRLVFITGCNSDEKEITPFNHPVIVSDRGRPTVCCDVRAYLTKQEEQPLNLNDVTRDKGNLEFCAYRSVITADYLAGNIGLYKRYIKSVVSAYALFTSYVIDSIIKLNPGERSNIELASAYFALHNFIPNDELKDPSSKSLNDNMLKANLGRIKIGYPVNGKYIDEVFGTLQSVEYTGTIDNLLDYLKVAIGNEKKELINKNAFISVISNMWFGHGGPETMIMSLEHMPTWISLLYSATTNTIFKRSRFSTVLFKFSKQIDIPVFVKDFALDMKDR